ncbi:hypothetical protein ABH942_000968 [Flavobacterium sp. 28YEA47A]|uniref:hypothetical protein n=1 Tax=Flavobacterium sp. 28YEA47A TaxID=3156276 RepID=UPI003512A663
MNHQKVKNLADLKKVSNLLKKEIEVCFNENKDNENFPNIINNRFREEFISFYNKYSSVPDEIIDGKQQILYFLNFGGIWTELINYQGILDAKRHGQL